MYEILHGHANRVWGWSESLGPLESINIWQPMIIIVGTHHWQSVLVFAAHSAHEELGETSGVICALQKRPEHCRIIVGTIMEKSENRDFRLPDLDFRDCRIWDGGTSSNEIVTGRANRSRVERCRGVRCVIEATSIGKQLNSLPMMFTGHINRFQTSRHHQSGPKPDFRVRVGFCTYQVSLIKKQNYMEKNIG